MRKLSRWTGWRLYFKQLLFLLLKHQPKVQGASHHLLILKVSSCDVFLISWLSNTFWRCQPPRRCPAIFGITAEGIASCHNTNCQFVDVSLFDVIMNSWVLFQQSEQPVRSAGISPGKFLCFIRSTLLSIINCCLFSSVSPQGTLEE